MLSSLTKLKPLQINEATASSTYPKSYEHRLGLPGDEYIIKKAHFEKDFIDPSVDGRLYTKYTYSILSNKNIKNLIFTRIFVVYFYPLFSDKTIDGQKNAQGMPFICKLRSIKEWLSFFLLVSNHHRIFLHSNSYSINHANKYIIANKKQQYLELKKIRSDCAIVITRN